MLRSFFSRSLLILCLSTVPAGVSVRRTIHGCGGAPGSSTIDWHSYRLAVGAHCQRCGFNGSACMVANRCDARGGSNVNGSLTEKVYAKRAPLGIRTVRYHTSLSSSRVIAVSAIGLPANDPRTTTLRVSAVPRHRNVTRVR